MHILLHLMAGLVWQMELASGHLKVNDMKFGHSDFTVQPYKLASSLSKQNKPPSHHVFTLLR